MKRLFSVLGILWSPLCCLNSAGAVEPLNRADEKAVLCLPDFGAEVRSFDAPEKRPVTWWPHVVNAAWGGGSGGPERNGGWLDQHWELVDYLDRAADYGTHDYLHHRGIWYEVYGSNEYQETIHFHEEGAKKLLWNNGIAQDMLGQRVVSEDYNLQVKWWAEQIGWDAYISCNNAPRWSAIIDYDWLTSPLLGDAISQDNIGGPLQRIGAGGHGRYCDFCSAKFFHHLALTGRLPEFRHQYTHIRDYVQANLMDVVRQLTPHAKWRGNPAEAQLLARLCEPPVMSEYQKFLYLSHLHNFIRYYRDAKLVAERRGVEYDVHGNQGGFFVGSDPYQIALADFVDTVWFESSGISAYEILMHGWNNSAGPFRYQIGQAMTRGRKPFMSMTAFHKHTPDVVEHEMAEACAGGGVLFVNQQTLEKEPQLLEKMTEYFRFRHAHRALYATAAPAVRGSPDPAPETTAAPAVRGSPDPAPETTAAPAVRGSPAPAPETTAAPAVRGSPDPAPETTARSHESGKPTVGGFGEVGRPAPSSRHAHRALYATPARKPFAEIALVYSIPTLMYRAYQYSADAAPHNALSGMARALEEGHLPFEVVLFNHPEIHADAVTLDELQRFRLVILPASECLSPGQIDLLTRYLEAGGTLGLLGDCGVRDEDNNPRAPSPAAAWRRAGRVVEILPGKAFLPARVHDGDETRQLTHTAIESVCSALGGRQPLSGELPRMLWVKAWRHGDDAVSWHWVNYDIDFASGAARPTEPFDLTLTWPAAVPAEEAVWLTPDGASRPLAIAVHGEQVQVTLPAVRVYGVLVIGRKGREQARSAQLQGDALLARAALASDGQWKTLAEDAAAVQTAGKRLAAEAAPKNNSLAPVLRGEGGGDLPDAARYSQAAARLLHACQVMRDQDYLAAVRRSASTDGAVLALDFGAKQSLGPWKAVAANAAYSAETGFGFLPGAADSDPSPEETDYAGVRRYGGSIATEVTASHLLFWPYREPAPAPLQTNLGCGGSRRFRVDVPPGPYQVRVVTTNASWSNRNFFVSGMVRVNGAVYLLDVPVDHGALADREVSVSTSDGQLEFTFGGPTGWAVAALVITPGALSEPDPQVAGALRRWHVSPRYANPDWYPIDQVRFSPEQRLASLPDGDWKLVQAPSAGLPVVDLGSNREAEVGDVAYAVTVIDATTQHQAQLHFGASSQAQLWLNGQPIGYVPNEKGIRRDELVVSLALRSGQNLLVVKLQRFWERRWLFYASLTEG